MFLSGDGHCVTPTFTTPKVVTSSTWSQDAPQGSSYSSPRLPRGKPAITTKMPGLAPIPNPNCVSFVSPNAPNRSPSPASQALARYVIALRSPLLSSRHGRVQNCTTRRSRGPQGGTSELLGHGARAHTCSGLYVAGAGALSPGKASPKQGTGGVNLKHTTGPGQHDDRMSWQELGRWSFRRSTLPAGTQRPLATPGNGRSPRRV